MNMRNPFTGMVTVEREGRAYTAQWKVQGNKIIVSWDNNTSPCGWAVLKRSQRRWRSCCSPN
jgi:hypothetical protein